VGLADPPSSCCAGSSSRTTAPCGGAGVPAVRGGTGHRGQRVPLGGGARRSPARELNGARQRVGTRTCWRQSIREKRGRRHV
jgi:hypothetical protein